MNRRAFLRTAGVGALALPELLRAGPAWAQSERARRLIVFYFPDGVAGRAQEGDANLWHFGDGPLPEQAAALGPHRGACVFINGLSMGSTDEGSHPGGARKLLTAVDQGQGRSIDRELARTVGQGRPHRHVYLGAMANQNSASGDKHISYPEAGFTAPPSDDPLEAFERLFGAGPVDAPEAMQRRDARLSVLDTIRADLADARRGLGRSELAKLDLHLEALREVEQRIQTLPRPDAPACGAAPDGIDRQALYAPEQFPAILDAQTALMVQAMACGLTQVGVIQASHHTSELIMSRFANTPLHDPAFDMRSHQASHYGPRHDPGRREFRDYVAQRAWFVGRFAALLDALAARPEGDGTMLDHSLVLLCSEVSDGNTHSHRDMPFILAGAGSGAVRTGAVINANGAHHGALFAALGVAMGAGFDRWAGSGPLGGLLS